MTGIRVCWGRCWKSREQPWNPSKTQVAVVEGSDSATIRSVLALRGRETMPFVRAPFAPLFSEGNAGARASQLDCNRPFYLNTTRSGTRPAWSNAAPDPHFYARTTERCVYPPAVFLSPFATAISAIGRKELATSSNSARRANCTGWGCRFVLLYCANITTD